MAMLVLTACQTAGIDAKIQQNLPAICSTAAKVHSSFLIVAASGNIKQRTIDREATAYQALLVVCENPESVTADTALVKAAEAYVIIAGAMREAKRN